MRCLTVLLLTALALLTTSCDRSREQIVGKWQVQNAPESMIWQFEPNGVVHAGNVKGRYSFGDQGRLKVETPTATFVYQLKLTDDAMVWREPSGAVTELRRVP